MDVRQVNLKIASAYDAVPYDTMADDGLDPARVLGLGAVYGARAHFGDVLDIGCGTGAQLRRAGDSMMGRLAGLDISPVLAAAQGPLSPSWATGPRFWRVTCWMWRPARSAIST